MVYMISGRELRVMVDLLETAAKAESLTPDQRAALSFDPLDIVTDLRGVLIGQVLVDVPDMVKTRRSRA